MNNDKKDEFINNMKPIIGMEKAQEFFEDGMFISTAFHALIEEIIKMADVSIMSEDNKINKALVFSMIHSAFITGVISYRTWLDEQKHIDVRKLEGRK
jgi:hypothetical protein